MTDMTATVLRKVCEAELVAARALEADQDNKELQHAWIATHGDRLRATHPVNVLALLDRLDVLEALQTPDQVIDEIFRIQTERDPDADPGDMSLSVDIQDDMDLVVVTQQYSFGGILDPYLGIGQTLQESLENALEKVRGMA